VDYDYTAELTDELSIRAGDVLTDVKQQDGGWWEGTLNGKRGLFPDNFVTVSSILGLQFDLQSLALKGLGNRVIEFM
jgi:hypothetical protein